MTLLIRAGQWHTTEPPKEVLPVPARPELALSLPKGVPRDLGVREPECDCAAHFRLPLISETSAWHVGTIT